MERVEVSGEKRLGEGECSGGGVSVSFERCWVGAVYADNSGLSRRTIRALMCGNNRSIGGVLALERAAEWCW